MFETQRHGRVGLAFPGLSRLPFLRHVFTTRDPAPERSGGGNLSLSGGRDREAALAERRFWSAWIDARAEDWVVGGQVHGAGVQVVDAAARGRGALDPATVLPETDALVTAERGLPLYVAVADCAALLLAAPGPRPALAVIHAGWRGLQAGIVAGAVDALCRTAGTGAGALLAGISPCIGVAHFAVGEEVARTVPERRRLRLAEGWHVDLAGWANDLLLAAGLPQAGIEAAGLDTFERADLFFSHRRDGPETGRMGLLAMLAPASPPAGPPRD